MIDFVMYSGVVVIEDNKGHTHSFPRSLDGLHEGVCAFCEAEYDRLAAEEEWNKDNSPPTHNID